MQGGAETGGGGQAARTQAPARGESPAEKGEGQKEGEERETEKRPLLIPWRDVRPGSGRVRAFFSSGFLRWAGPPGCRLELEEGSRGLGHAPSRGGPAWQLEGRSGRGPAERPLRGQRVCGPCGPEVAAEAARAVPRKRAARRNGAPDAPEGAGQCARGARVGGARSKPASRPPTPTALLCPSGAE